MCIYRRLLVAVCLAVCSLPLFAARTTPLQGPPPERLIETVREKKWIHLIIGVRDDEWRPERALSAADVARQRARGQAKRNELRRHYPDLASNPGADFIVRPYLVGVANEATLRKLLDDDRVVSIEEDTAGEPTLAESTARVKVVEAHGAGYTGANQMVVVVDSGVDSGHPDFGGRVQQGDAACFSKERIDGARDATNPYQSTCPNGATIVKQTPGSAEPCQIGTLTDPNNACHHGTKVAGVLAGNNGVAKGAGIIPIKAASYICDISGPCTVSMLKSSVIRALEYVSVDLVAKHPGKIASVNISWTLGGLYSSRATCDTNNPLLVDYVADVHAEGIAVVAATGNGHSPTTIGVPACISNVVAVSATTDVELETVPDYANTASIMDLFAPGGDEAPAPGILTTQNRASGQSSIETSGTSLASPHVAGAFAILRQRAPLAKPAKLLRDLHVTGAPVDDTRSFGKRRINIFGALVRTRYDHNGDGKADIYWRNTATGSNWMYEMNGIQVTSLPTRNEPNLAWKVAGIGDVDGDYKADIIWRNSVTGVNWLYQSNGGGNTTSFYINQQSNLDWKIAGVGDFDGDNKADIYWRNSTTGQNWIYFMNGSTIVSNVATRNETNLDWKVVATGDFTGDGKDDVFWRNSSNGQNYIYEMNGATATPWQVTTEPNQAWQVAGAGDFNADGKDDILWRNSTTGDNFIYFMQGQGATTGALINRQADQAWKIANVADYDGNGIADILWRNANDGRNWIYFMNDDGTIATSTAMQNEPDLNWTIQR